MDRLAGLAGHRLEHHYPCRVPVWWGRTGDVGKDPGLIGVSGRRVVIRIPKQFKRLEAIFAKWFRAPRELRRPLDSMNSMVWELCDGSRTFAEVCTILDSIFQESIAPVLERTTAALRQFEANNLMLILEEPLNQRWHVGPGKTPEHQVLEELSDGLKIDATPLEGEAV